jgi:hypothetical protein
MSFNSFLCFSKLKYTVTCIPIARQRLGKHIPAKHTGATEGGPLIGNEPVNTLL